MTDLLRRCVGTPPPGHLACAEPATHWQIRVWGDGWGGTRPVHLDLCAGHYHATLDRRDVSGHGSH